MRVLKRVDGLIGSGGEDCAPASSHTTQKITIIAGGHDKQGAWFIVVRRTKPSED